MHSQSTNIPSDKRKQRSSYGHEYDIPVSGPFAKVVEHFSDKHLITIAAGATCAYLGDERNLREFLIADETARQLRQAGHTVVSFLVDDSMEALNERQLRVAVNKDPKLIERYQHWCGQPIGHLPDPFGCHKTFAGHFEEELLNRLHHLECHPILVSTSDLYKAGAYKPYVNIVLEQYDEILEFCRTRFLGYEPEKLFYPLCPHCQNLQETTISSIQDHHLHFYCQHCEKATIVHFDEIKGKLNWKLDCAARWVLLSIDAEPFNKSYLEPQNGTFVVAQALSREYFGGHTILPIHHGLVTMENQYSYKLLKSLPGPILRKMLVQNPQTDIKLTRDLVITASSRHKVMADLTYQGFIKQILPMWVLTPHSLTPDQRNLVAYGLAFREHFLDEEARLHLPARRHFQMQEPAVLTALRRLLLDVIELRNEKHESDEQLSAAIKKTVLDMGDQRKSALHWLRVVIGQEQGLPASRLLLALPLDYLTMIEYMLEVHLYMQNLTPIDDEQPDGSQTAPLVQPLTERRRVTLDDVTSPETANNVKANA